MKRIGKMFMRIGIVFAVIILAAGCTVFIARMINAGRSKIVTENGIQESRYLEVGGIEQFVQIRGKDKSNPVILWLHGGPGYPLTYLSYYYQTALESDYTIVCWEQRGCGRTYYKNDNQEVSVDLLLNDTDELVDYLRERFGQDKIIILGQSWGTVLGSIYVNKYPEKVSAYIGTGQVVDFDRGKIYAALEATAAAEARGNTKDAAALRQALNTFMQSSTVDEIDINNLEKMIILSLKYLRSDGEMSGIKQMWIGISSPYMSFADFKWFLNVSSTDKIFNLEKSLIQYMYYQFNINKLGRSAVPVYYIQGGSDWITPTSLVAEFYEHVNAPDKNMVIIKDAGHTPFLDNPQLFCDAVKAVLENVSR